MHVSVVVCMHEVNVLCVCGCVCISECVICCSQDSTATKWSVCSLHSSLAQSNWPLVLWYNYAKAGQTDCSHLVTCVWRHVWASVSLAALRSALPSRPAEGREMWEKWQEINPEGQRVSPRERPLRCQPVCVPSDALLLIGRAVQNYSHKGTTRPWKSTSFFLHLRHLIWIQLY